MTARDRPNCAVCGSPFEPTGRGYAPKRFCSARCRETARRRRQRAKQAEPEMIE